MHRIKRIILALFALLFLTACNSEKQGITIEHMVSSKEAEITEETGKSTDESGKTEDLSVSATTETEADGASAETEFAEEIRVYICGQVNAPGVYAIPSGSRVVDLIALAGGLTADANVAAVNQAMWLSDGEMVYIPKEGEDYIPQSNNPSGQGPTGNPNSGATTGDSGKVNLNTATKEDLMSIPGIGEAKAAAILEYRDTNGGFRTKEDLMQVPGIKEGTYKKIENYLAD